MNKIGRRYDANAVFRAGKKWGVCVPVLTGGCRKEEQPVVMKRALTARKTLHPLRLWSCVLYSAAYLWRQIYRPDGRCSREHAASLKGVPSSPLQRVWMQFDRTVVMMGDGRSVQDYKKQRHVREPSANFANR